LDRDAMAVRVEHRDGEIGPFGAEELPREHLAGAPRVLGSDDAREVAADGVPHECLCSRVQPADPALAIEDVARHAQALERGAEVARSGLELPRESRAPVVPAA